MTDAPISVLLADDDEGFLVSLREPRRPPARAAASSRPHRTASRRSSSPTRLEPDAAVIDLHMPLLDGVSAIARLRRDHPSLCLIALTGDDDRKLHEAVERAGADAVLEKGEMVGALIDRLTSARVA